MEYIYSILLYNMNYIPASSVAAIAGRHRYVTQNEGISKNLETYNVLIWDELMAIASNDIANTQLMEVITDNITGIYTDSSLSATDNISLLSDNPDVRSLLSSLHMNDIKPVNTSTMYVKAARALIKEKPVLTTISVSVDSESLTKSISDSVNSSLLFESEHTQSIPVEKLQQAIMSEISMHRGTVLEDSTMTSSALSESINRLYPRNTITKPKKIYKRYFSTDPTTSIVGYANAADVPRCNMHQIYTISGCVDSVVSCADTGVPLCILEIKNRMKHFYAPEHDLIQLYVYILLCNIPKGHLVQQLSGRIRVSEVITHDTAMHEWSIIKTELDNAVLLSYRIKTHKTSYESLSFLKTCTF